MLAKLKILFIIGIFVLVLPYVGIPGSWKNLIEIALGAFIIYIVFSLKHDYKLMKIKLGKVDQPITNTENHG